MFKVRTRKVRKGLGVQVRGREIARAEVPPSFRVLVACDPEPYARAEGPEILERAAEARQDEAVDRGA